MSCAASHKKSITVRRTVGFSKCVLFYSANGVKVSISDGVLSDKGDRAGMGYEV